MAANLVSAGANIAFWDEQTLSKNPNLQKCDPPDALKCNSHWNSLSFSPSNESLACAESRGGDVRILSLSQEQKTVELAITLHKDGASYTCCEFMPSKQRYIFCGGKGGDLSLWDLKLNSIVKSYSGHSSSVTSITSHHSYPHLVSGSSNGAILVHPYASSLPQKVLAEPAGSGGSGKNAISHLVLSPYERGMVASCNTNGSVSFWSSESQRQVAHFPGAHTGAASRLCFSPYNRMLLASCGTEGNFVFYDIMQRKTLSKTQLSCPLFSVCLLNDGTTLVGGGADGKLHVFDLRNCTAPRDTLPAHTSPVYCLMLQNNISSRHRKSTTRTQFSSSKGLPSASTPAPLGKESTGLKAKGERVPQSPPAGASKISPVGRDSAAVGGSAVGGDSIFSPLTTGASPSDSGRVSGQSDTSMRKTRSLPQRPGGIGLERQFPVPHSKDHGTPSQGNPPFSTTFDLFTSSESRENVEGSPGRAHGKPALHSTAITTGGPTVANKFFSASSSLSPVHTAASTSTGLAAGVLGSPTGVPHAGLSSLTPPSTRPVGVPPPAREAPLSRAVDRGDHLDGAAEKKVSSTIPAPATGDLLRGAGPDPVEGGMSPVILKFLQAMVDDSTEDLRMSFNRELMHLYSDILRQLSLQEKKSESAFSKLESLVAENRRLQEQNRKLMEENKRLKTLY